MLDTPEYIHLAIHASKKGDNHAALNYLKEALNQEPENAVARYLLAAEHAEIGLYEKAIDGMQATLKLAPALEIAEFQLGLLHLQVNRPDDALLTFENLGGRVQDPALAAFSQAYQQLIRGNNAQAIQHLKDGIAVCSNEHLTGDMQRVLVRLTAEAESSTAPAAQPAEPAASAIILGAYRDSLDPS